MGFYQIPDDAITNIWSPYWFWQYTIPPFVCDEIVNYYKDQDTQYTDGMIYGSTDESHKSKHSNIRSNKVIFLEDAWINAMLFGYIQAANAVNFNYVLSNMDKEMVQFTKYSGGNGVGKSSDNFYGPHQDFCIDKTNLAHLRKLSCTVQLSDGVDYVGGDLILDLPAYGQDGSQRLSMDSRTENERFIMSRDKGSLVIFDSRIVHEITPITSGTRYSLVKWASGDEPLR